MKVYRMIWLALVVVASANISAQNATKAELDALSQRFAKLEADLERVITENVNLVEQLNIKTVTSYTDENKIQWDIVRVEPNKETNEVIVSLRLTNNSGLKQKVFIYPSYSYALDSDTNRSNNKYDITETPGDLFLEHGIPVNATVKIANVPITSSYLSLVQLGYTLAPIYVKFKGVHIPW